MESRSKTKIGQRGLSLTGLIFVLFGLGLVAVLALKVFPTVSEYIAIKKAIAGAKAAGSTVAEVRTSFDKQAEVGYIESISGKDLEVIKNGDVFDVSFAYQKVIPLAGPASLLIDYEGTTAATRPVNSVKKAAQ
jgi:hypothetical protein